MYKDRTVRITVTGPAQNTINTKQIDPFLDVLCEAVLLPKCSGCKT